MHSVKRMKGGVSGAILAFALSAIVGTAPASAAQEPCVSGAEVRTQVQQLVAGLRDDVKSHRARAATRAALVESMRTYRGARAGSAEERRALGQEIATLAKRGSETRNRVEGRALAVEIVALTAQRERGRFTPDEREELRTAAAKLRRAVVARTSSQAEAQEVANEFKALHQQFTCTTN